MFPLEFHAVVKLVETRVMALCLGRAVRPYDRSMSHIDTVPACDGRTDGRIYYSYSALHTDAL